MVKITKRHLAYIYLLINVLTWGAFLPIVKLGFNESSISPFRYLFYRFTLAGFLSIPIIIHYWPTVRRKWQAIKNIIIIELIGTSLALSLLYIGLEKTSALETNLIAMTLPVFITIAGVFFLHERQEKHEWVGLVLAFAGTLLLVAEPIWSSTFLISGSLTGNFLIIGYNVLTTLYFLLAKRHYARLPKLFVSAVSFFVGIATFALLSLYETGFHVSTLLSITQSELSSPLVLGVIIYAAVFGSIIGLTTYIKGQDSIEASEASFFSYLQPVVFIPLGFMLLKETITPLQVMALAVVIAGVYIAERRKG